MHYLQPVEEPGPNRVQSENAQRQVAKLQEKKLLREEGALNIFVLMEYSTLF